MMALVSANLINVAANWILVFGHLGVPPLGVDGAAWATCVSRVYLALFLLLAIARHDRLQRTGLRHIDRLAFKKIIGIFDFE